MQKMLINQRLQKRRRHSKAIMLVLCTLLILVYNPIFSKSKDDGGNNRQKADKGMTIEEYQARRKGESGEENKTSKSNKKVSKDVEEIKSTSRKSKKSSSKVAESAEKRTKISSSKAKKSSKKSIDDYEEEEATSKKTSSKKGKQSTSSSKNSKKEQESEEENASEELEEEEFTIDEAVDYALENSKSLKSSEIDLEMKKRAKAYSWNNFLPSLQIQTTANRITGSTTYDTIRKTVEDGVNLGYAGTGQKPSKSVYNNMMKKAGFETSDEEKYHWAWVWGLDAKWVFNAAYIEQIKVAATQYEQGKITYEQKVKEMSLNIRKLYYGLLVQQEALNIERTKLTNAEARYNQATKNFNAGIVPRLSMLQAQVNFENQKPEVLSAEQSLKQNMDTLAFLMGFPYGKKIKLTSTIDVQYVDLDADKLFNDYIDNNLDVRSLKKNIELLKQALTAKRFATFIPTLALGYTFNPVTLYAADDWPTELSESDKGSLNITLLYNNLFDMLPISQNMQSMKDMKQQIAQAELGIEQLYQNSENEVHTLVDNLEKCKKNIESMQNNITLAQAAYDATQTQYNRGTIEYLEVKDSENSLNQAKLGLMNEKMNYVNAVLDIEQKLNIKLSDLEDDSEDYEEEE